MVKLPRYKDPTPDRRAKAPYNFVPLLPFVAKIDPRRLPDQNVYAAKLYTGRLVCALETASPLFIRAALTQAQYDIAASPDEKKRPWREQLRNNPSFYTRDLDAAELDRRPVIPGSSLRGLLRAMVEIASFSKFDAITDQKLVYRAVGDTTSHGAAYRDRLMRLDGEDYQDGKRCYRYTPLMRAGYMHRTSKGWQIIPAQEVNGVSFARISNSKIPTGLEKSKRAPDAKNTSELWVSVGPYDYQLVRGGFIRIRYARVQQASTKESHGLREACLVRSGWMPNKRSEAVIFAPDENADRIDVPDKLIEEYQDQVETILTTKATRGGRRESLLGNSGVLVENHPVFYLIERGKLVFFGHCMMFRIPYPNSLRDFVPETLRREVDTDFAEALFGFSKGARSQEGVNWSKAPAKARAYASRLSISDAVAQGEPPKLWLREEPLVPRILGTPKPTTFQHYLVQPTPNAIPAGKTRDGRQKTRLDLLDYAAQPTDETVVRGHKLYWHKGDVGVAQIEEPPEVLRQLHDNDTQHTLMRPVRSGVKFTFQIAFENLSSEELGALLWVLDIAADDRYCLSLGMGKPYGMGAVRITSDLVLSDRALRYTQLFDAQGDWALAETPAPTQTRQQCIDDFESRVLDLVRARDARRLRDLSRIQAFLALLSWPGPDPAETRYLEIEHDDPHAKGGKLNEYRDRPVLPDPLLVMREHGGKAASTPAQARPPQQKAPPQDGEEQADDGANFICGTVRRYQRGSKSYYGFIVVDDPALRGKYGERDIFVHESKLASGLTTLEPGQRVVFRAVRGMKGWEAHDVELVTEDSQ